MKKITTIIMFVLCGLFSFSQSEYCYDMPFITIRVCANENLLDPKSGTLIKQNPDALNPLYETYKFSEINCGEDDGISVIVVLLDGCGDEEQAKKDLENTKLFSSVSILHNLPTTSCESIEAANAFNVNNPVFNELNLVLPNKTNEIKIFDIQGKTVLQTECGETASINVSMLPKGVYTLVVNNSGSQKFVKE